MQKSLLFGFLSGKNGVLRRLPMLLKIMSPFTQATLRRDKTNKQGGDYELESLKVMIIVLVRHLKNKVALNARAYNGFCGLK